MLLGKSAGVLFFLFCSCSFPHSLTFCRSSRLSFYLSSPTSLLFPPFSRTFSLILFLPIPFLPHLSTFLYLPPHVFLSVSFLLVTVCLFSSLPLPSSFSFTFCLPFLPLFPSLLYLPYLSFLLFHFLVLHVFSPLPSLFFFLPFRLFSFSFPSFIFLLFPVSFIFHLNFLPRIFFSSPSSSDELLAFFKSSFKLFSSLSFSSLLPLNSLPSPLYLFLRCLHFPAVVFTSPSSSLSSSLPFFSFFSFMEGIPFPHTVIPGHRRELSGKSSLKL